MDSKRLAAIAIIAALEVVFDSIVTPTFTEGVWYGLIFVMSPLAGIVLGPRDGFVSTLTAVLVGHTISPRGIYEYLFTLGAPICSLITGYAYRGKIKPALILYTVMFGAYFATPVSWSLPLWGVWDTLLAYFVTILLVLKPSKFLGRKRLAVGFSALIGLEADVLFRIFLFIPCQTYRIIYGFTPEVLYVIWAFSAPIITPLKVAVSVAITAFSAPTIMKVIGELSDRA